MANSRQKEQKKKHREKMAKERVLRRRTALRAERKKIEEEQRREQEAHDLVHGKPRPFVKNPLDLSAREQAKSDLAKEKLKKNLEILEALEREYDAEQAARAEVHQKLESEGHTSMKDKMDALHQKALELTGKAEELAQANQEYNKDNDLQPKTSE